MTVAVVVQARLGSSRLPGKVLAPIGDRSLLAMVVERAARAMQVDRVIVATTEAPSDDAVEVAARQSGADVVRGSEYDVLARFGSALAAFPDIDIVVRVTADCPFVDPDVIDELVREQHQSGADFVANRLPPPWKRTYPVGLDVEIATRAALETAVREASVQRDREHVMPFLYLQPERFSVIVRELDEDLSHYRWTVDEPADLSAVRELARRCGPEPFGWRSVLEVARREPWINSINAAAVQKPVWRVDSRWDDKSETPTRPEVP